MKVKMKAWKGADDREVVATVHLKGGPNAGRLVYLFSNNEWGFTDDYEIIPEARWVDVTAECMLFEGWRLRHGNTLINAIPPSLGYRLRKVCDCDPMPPVAFVIEKQE